MTRAPSTLSRKQFQTSRRQSCSKPITIPQHTTIQAGISQFIYLTIHKCCEIDERCDFLAANEDVTVANIAGR